MWCRTAVALLIGGGCCLTSPARALEKPEFCRAYAKAAVASARENVRLKCGLTGSRYSPSWQLHYGWCMSAGRGSVAGERNIRMSELQACRR